MNLKLDSDYLVNDFDKTKSEFICKICKCLFNPNSTVQLPCSHMYCKFCIDNTIKMSGFRKCPICFKPFNNYEYIKTCNLFAYNILSDLLIKCPNNKCNKQIKYTNLSYHLDKCDFKLMNCRYCDKKNIYRKDYKIHLKENFEDHFLSVIELVEKISKRLGIEN